MSMNEKIVLEIARQNPDSTLRFSRLRSSVCGKFKTNQPSNRDLFLSYQKLLKEKRMKKNELLEKFLKKSEIRTMSGVAIITSLTKPYPCPGQCVYCPKQAKMPKSYLASEPAAARALTLDFDPYEQMWKRVETLQQNGHPTDKIEFIIKGGSWQAYPLSYQFWFILRSIQAANDFPSRKRSSMSVKEDFSTGILLKNLIKEQKKNESAKCRVIGLTTETRPDMISAETAKQMRDQGVTRVEIGAQATDDEILAKIGRGHTLEQTKNALLLLRQAGFKTDVHFMPDLPGSNPEKDVQMYKKLFSDPGLKPDMVKIYPCTVIESAPLFELFKKGKYRPYEEKELFEAILEMKKNTPRYCRISRLVRDIPAPEIRGGNSITNLRENLQKEMKKRGEKCLCIRCREIGRATAEAKKIKPKIFLEKYDTLGGEEIFLSFEDPKRETIFGFLRLRLPDKKSDNEQIAKLRKLLPQISDCAFVRELHVYGQMIEIGKKKKNAAQHQGLGRRLLLKAETIARQKGFKKLAVISGVGVRGYYRSCGYRLSGGYMVKKI